ncbi:MAG: hypothetical protein NVSMB1_08730 [Polyangiales bacterium]
MDTRNSMSALLRFVACATLVACDPPNVPRSANANANASAHQTTIASACALPERPVAANDADRNVEGSTLAVCSGAPLIGFFRDGRCSTGLATRMCAGSLL